MPRQRIDRSEIVDTAVELVDQTGFDTLSLARVAEHLGVQASALYNHIDGLDALRAAVVSRATQNLAGRLRDAAVGRSGERALTAIADAYRDFAKEHPGQYASTVATTCQTPNVAAAHRALAEVLVRVIEGFGVTGDQAVHAARVVRSAIHGFVSLESNQAFPNPQDRDDTYSELTRLLVRGLEGPPSR